MLKRPLGSTGLDVSVLGLGTVKIGRNQGVKYPTGAFALPDDAAVERLLDLALDCGISLLDTSPAYGTSEERLGKLLGARRDRFVLVSKAGEEFADGASAWDFSPAALERSVARSLKRLRTDRLDLLLLHCNPDDLRTVADPAVLATLQALKAKGAIRAFGASTYSVEAGLKTIETMDVAMVALHASDRSQLPVIEAAARLKKGILIKKGLDSGRQATSRRDTFASILRTEGVASLVVGTIDPAHLEENARLAGALLGC